MFDCLGLLRLRSAPKCLHLLRSRYSNISIVQICSGLDLLQNAYICSGADLGIFDCLGLLRLRSAPKCLYLLRSRSSNISIANQICSGLDLLRNAYICSGADIAMFRLLRSALAQVCSEGFCSGADIAKFRLLRSAPESSPISQLYILSRCSKFSCLNLLQSRSSDVSIAQICSEA